MLQLEPAVPRLQGRRRGHHTRCRIRAASIWEQECEHGNESGTRKLRSSRLSRHNLFGLTVDLILSALGPYGGYVQGASGTNDFVFACIKLTA